MRYVKRNEDVLPIMEHLARIKEYQATRMSAFTRWGIEFIDHLSNRFIVRLIYIPYLIALFALFCLSAPLFCVVLVKWAFHWFASLFFHSAILHRWGSHGSFRFKWHWDKVAMAATYLSHHVSALVVKKYRFTHLNHHTNSDTLEDSHAPHYFNNFISMMVFTAKKYASYDFYKPEVLQKLYGRAPQLAFIDKLGDMDSMRLFWSVIILVTEIGLYFVFDMPAWSFFLVLFTATPHYLMSMTQGIAVNWFGHESGTINHPHTGDKSRNTFLNFVLMGEGNQNNHHHNPLKACYCDFNFWLHIKKAQFRKCFAHLHEIDPTYAILVLWSKCNIIEFTDTQDFAPA